jgi:phage terminase large subunit
MVGQLQTTPVFDWNFSSTKRIKINQGGTSSSKTYAILQVIFMRLIQKKRVCTVVGQDIPNLKKGALRDFEFRILSESPWMWLHIESYNKAERLFIFKNGSRLEFSSFKDWQDAKNGKRDIAFFNEVNGIDQLVYEQIAMRTSEEIFLDYNPSEEFWVHEKLMPLRESVTFYSNYTHNPFINENIKEYILSLKDIDEEAWNVYGLGKTGSISELIFPKITIVDEMPKNLRNRGYGMDFGYVNDPTTLIECGLMNQRDVFLNEVFYKYKMKTSDIDREMKEKEVSKGLNILADSSEAMMIDDLSASRWRIEGAKKGSGSIMYGINLLKDYNIHITASSLNLLNERSKYKFKVDKKSGKTLNEPIDAFNHAWDGIRYWATENLKPLRKVGGVRRVN